MDLNVVRSLTIKARTEGAEQATKALNQIADGHARVSSTAQGMAVATDRVSLRSLSAADAFERMAQRMDKLAYIAAAEAKMMSIANRAMDQGVVSAERHSEVMQRITTKYDGMRSAEISRRAQLEATTAAMDGQSAAATRLAAANENISRGGPNTSNIAAQFQDIGVTSAMGMSPIMIALQQGTQLSAEFQRNALGLRGTIASLAGAFASILSPVSLVTIGVVALGAVGIQALMGMMNKTDDATRSLEDHKKWLDEVLAGYDAVGNAADMAMERASRLPEGVVRSDLLVSLKDQREAIETTVKSAADLQAQLSAAVGIMKATDNFGEVQFGGDMIGQVEMLRDLGLSANSTRAELELAATSARDLYNATDDTGIGEMADQVYMLAMKLLQARGEAESTLSALAALNNMNVQIDIGISTEKAADAIAQIKGLAPELRSIREQAADALASAMKAPDAIMRQAGQEAFRETIAALDEQERRQGEIKAANTAGKTAAQTVDAYGDIVKSAQDRIEQLQIEQQALGMTAEAANALRYAHDLLSQAEGAGVSIDAAKTDELTGLAAKMAQAQAETDRLTKAFQDQQQSVDDVLGTIGSAFSGLFNGTIRDFDSFIDHMVDGFAKLGQDNLAKLFTLDGLKGVLPTAPTGANDNAGPIPVDVTNSLDISKGFGELFKNNPQLAGLAVAGLGGLGMGVQARDPMMGALGGAMQGFMAGGGFTPAGAMGAVVGGIGGKVGPLFPPKPQNDDGPEVLIEKEAA